MIIFDELKVTPDGRNLIIDISVPKIKGYENVTIEQIDIETLETFIEGSSKVTSPIMTIPVENKTSFRIEIPTSTLNGPDNLFFVWVKNTMPSIEADCGADNTTSLGVTFNKCPMYNSFMQSVKELDYECRIPKEFIDGFLKYKALLISIETCHYNQAIKYFNEFYSNIKLEDIKSCGCYG